MSEEPRREGNPLRLVLLGPPGAGKGTQAATLAQRLSLAHVASGDLLREHRAKGTELGQQASSYMQQGLLVPDELVIRMVLERIGQEDSQGGVVLDGFPRTLEQAEVLDQTLNAPGIQKAICIEVSQKELVRRLGGRLTCRNCQAPYQESTAPERCLACGGELYQRDDDRPEAVQQRIQVYETQTAPLLDYYREQGKLHTVNGEQEVGAVTHDLLQLMKAGGQPGRLN